jgi:predicted transcriptional regulator
MTPKKKLTPPPLHELESLVMDEVWRQEEATVRNILEALNKRGKKRAYTTIMTIMVRLEDKGLLRRRADGRSHRYTPMMSREDYLAARAKGGVDELLADYGDLALAQFASKVDSLDPKRRDQLRKLAGES